MRPFLLVGIAALGCHAAQPITTPEARLGTFAFVAQAPTRQVVGTLHVMPDTVLVEPRSGQCRVPMQPNGMQSMRYECFGVDDYDVFEFSFDRMNPLQHSSWRAQWTVQRSRQECSAWAVNAAGQRVCVATATVMYDAPAWASGKLWVKRTVDAPGA